MQSLQQRHRADPSTRTLNVEQYFQCVWAESNALVWPFDEHDSALVLHECRIDWSCTILLFRVSTYHWNRFNRLQLDKAGQFDWSSKGCDCLQERDPTRQFYFLWIKRLSHRNLEQRRTSMFVMLSLYI